MAWTTPRTWVSTEQVSASIMNTHVRDNLNETAAAKATSASGLIVTTGANTVIQRTPDNAVVATSETTSSTSYTNLSTSGPAVTVTTGTRALVVWAAAMSNTTAGAISAMGMAISGDTTLSASDDLAFLFESNAASDLHRGSMAQLYTGLTAGSNTFTAKYRVDSGTGAFQNRRMSVIPL